ncbi:pyruvate, phosphate dikinase [Nocardia sp. NPDC052278]|uniref:pyruvate, phosphate dikinase n=1 Tax=unclassified Nocardia TaxID=2637762 RepID=UPI00369859DD
MPSELVLRLDGSVVHPREVVGGKAHGIAKMRASGFRTPPAFVVTVEACRRYFAEGEALIDDIWGQVLDGIAWLESETEHTFGGTGIPLLVSVRSGAAQSMPGMMDTILNLGMNDETEHRLATAAGAQFAADTHRRFRELYSKVVGPLDQDPPSDPWVQLRAAIRAVFESWNSARAAAYRGHHGITTLEGTAVTVQAMVFGNLDDMSGTGVLFSRNPLTGAAEPYGEWLPRGQGEDVVSGRFDPLRLSALAEQMPAVHTELLSAADKLERQAADVQDIEFTVESGTLYLLQTRNAKRSAHAAVRFAVAFENEGLIDKDEALGRVDLAHVRTALEPTLPLETKTSAELLASGVPACPGIAQGIVVTDPVDAEDAADDGVDAVLARETTSPDDVSGMIAAVGIITELGGSTSHAAVVSRELHRPCVVGCGAGALAQLAGQEVTVDGGTGEIFAGILPLTALSEDSDADLAKLLEWATAATDIVVHRPGTVPDGVEAVQVEYTNPRTIADALAGGYTHLISEHPLPVLLAARR